MGRVIPQRFLPDHTSSVFDIPRVDGIGLSARSTVPTRVAYAANTSLGFTLSLRVERNTIILLGPLTSLQAWPHSLILKRSALCLRDCRYYPRVL
jgi:hypothetical protein